MMKDEACRKILDIVQHQEITVKELQELFYIPLGTIKRYVTQMIKEGKIKQKKVYVEEAHCYRYFLTKITNNLNG